MLTSVATQHADIFSSFGYALTLTLTHAIVWPYTSTAQSPETFSFTLPSTGKYNDSLPVGCLVSPSAASTEPGLVVVMPSGKVVYWESISSAATFAFMKNGQSGIEHTIYGMSSGERASAITSAESAGFILTFNTGRLAYMNVRDNHGRPHVSVQFLRTNSANTSGGLFGSIRNAFSHLSLRGDIAAVRADRSSRVGEKNIVAMGTKGRLQAWKVHRGGHHEPIGEVDAQETIIAAVNEQDSTSQGFPVESFETLDFTFVPKGLEPKYLNQSRFSDALGKDNSMIQHLLVLVSLTQRSRSRYCLVEAILTPTSFTTGMIRPITAYSTPITKSETSQTSRPRLYLPRPALVAFVVFDRAAVIASVAGPPESPDSQLQSDNHVLPSSFEDVIDFREDEIHLVVGSGFEETPPASLNHEEARLQRHKSKNPAAVLFVRGAGVIRLSTTDVDKFASDQPPIVSAKSKLEQAVFFGTKQNNPLIFDKREEVHFSNEEVALAALEVSNEILRSSTTYISTLPAHLEENLRARAVALERLISQVKQMGAKLDRRTKWELLHNAEKMHVAYLLWKLHESTLASRAADDKKNIIGSIVEFIHEDQKANPNSEIGEIDRVRHWFINDIYRLDIFVAWAYEAVKVMYKDRLADSAKLTVFLLEAMRINLATQNGAFEFRRNNLAVYELDDDIKGLNILGSGYEEIREPWTGCYFIANNLKRLVDLSIQWVETGGDGGMKGKNAAKPDARVMEQIRTDLPNLVDAMLTSVLEHARFMAAQTSQKDRAAAQEFYKIYQTYQKDIPLRLARKGQWQQAARLAEKHHCLSGLAIILVEHIGSLEGEMESPDLSPMQKQTARTSRASKKTDVERCLKDYGETFAFPLYDYLLEAHGIHSVLDFELDKYGFKTKYLRNRPDLAKISWIHDVQHEKNVNHAAKTLVDLAFAKEQHAWSKKVELSLGKLALLAEAEEENSLLKVKADEAYREDAISRIDAELISIRIQDELYKQIVPSTREAVDEAAALSFAMDAHSTNIPRRRKAPQQIFEDGIKRLLRHETLDPMTLIDLLTLVYLSPEAKRGMMADPFWLALKVAAECCPKEEVAEAKKLIWRRLLIRDDWARLNDTQLKNDDEIAELLMETELYSMLTDCIRYRKSSSTRLYSQPLADMLSTEDARKPFRPTAPRDALGAFTTELDRRFRDFDSDFRNKLKDAMKAEDKILSQFIEKHRLQDWLAYTWGAAKSDIESELDTGTQNGNAVAPEDASAVTAITNDSEILSANGASFLGSK
jgi:nuclear pore complex protein Nup133